MPVPKRKTSKARRDQRSSSWFIRTKSFSSCSECEHPLNPHQACANCGFYKGRKVIKAQVDRDLRQKKSYALKEEQQRQYMAQREAMLAQSQQANQELETSEVSTNEEPKN